MREVLRGGVRMRFPDIGTQVQVLYLLGQQLVWSALGIAAVVFAMKLSDRGQDEASDWVYGGAGFAGFMFCWNFLTNCIFPSNHF